MTILQSRHRQVKSCSDAEEDDDPVLQPLPLKIKSYTEALNAIDDVSALLESRGHVSEATKMMTFSNEVTSLRCESIGSLNHLSLSATFNPYTLQCMHCTIMHV